MAKEPNNQMHESTAAADNDEMRESNATAAAAELEVESIEQAVDEDAADFAENPDEGRAENPTDDGEGKTDLHELDSLKQQLLRAHADFDNFRRRTRQEKEDLQLFATRKLLADLLPVVDNFQRALATFATNDANSEMQTGLEMVHRQFISVLEQYGVQRMEAEGKPFDPNFHEAVLQEPADGRETGIVAQELQSGYILHGRVLRPAMVKVTI